MSEHEFLTAFTDVVNGTAGMETLMEQIYDAVDDVVYSINPSGTFTLEKLLRFSNPILLNYVNSLKWNKRAAIEEEFRSSVFMGRFIPLRPKYANKGVNYYFFDN